MKKKLPQSVRKHIRREKTRIRREGLNAEERKKQIDELYQKFSSLPAASLKDIAEKIQEKTD